MRVEGLRGRKVNTRLWEVKLYNSEPPVLRLALYVTLSFEAAHPCNEILASSVHCSHTTRHYEPISQRIISSPLHTSPYPCVRHKITVEVQSDRFSHRHRPDFRLLPSTTLIVYPGIPGLVIGLRWDP